MGGGSAVITGAFTPAFSIPSLPSRSRSIGKLKDKPLIRFQRHSNFCSASLSHLKRIVNNSKCDISAQCSLGEAEEPSEDDFVVVNFYHFVFIKNPETEVARHLSFLEGLDIHGRVYLNEQGINAQYSGPSKDALLYVKWLREDYRFSDILVQISPAFNGHAFPKLRLRYKPSLLQMEGGILHLPLLDPSMRATPLPPSKWRKRLEAVDGIDDASHENSSSNYILLDVRNGYEWDIGHFSGAQRPSVDCFRSTSIGLSPIQNVASDPLANADKENTDILMYCTGGIRCDVYSTILRCCTDCMKDLRGCCCVSCITAPRLRPVLPGHQRYRKWHVYRDLKCKVI
ncbi:rhodanese-like domain-containing protein 8, chloroplastic isoform X2 [Carya illinoinensis]|uniref:rhodanese-like domain-containing protein 8, chloroplastic isoform X2 n=1 Tax=Carya illinoinensis TaxID=32201 RepID=UPI001C719D3F|nr:rhodanese-like domain-containing protein 8, chloroplastic isoform X2 [Carya illinoinensis]